MSEGSFPKSVAGNGVFWKGSLASVLSWNLEVLEFFGSWKTRKPGGGVRGMRGGHNFSKLWDSNYWVNYVSPITVWLSTFFQPCSLGLVELLFIFYFLQFCSMLFFCDLNMFSIINFFSCWKQTKYQSINNWLLFSIFQQSSMAILSIVWLFICIYEVAFFFLETRQFFDDLCVKHNVDCSPPRTTTRLLDKVCAKACL